MQMKICDELDTKRKQIEHQRPVDKTWRQERDDRKRYFEANFKYGSTTVLRHNGESFLMGDIKHCGTENIFFNARNIKSMMEANGQTMGHMNYNDPPTFSSKWDWEKEEKERKEIYKDDLYKFVGDEIVVADLIGTEPIGHIYKDEPTDSEEADPVCQKNAESVA